MFVSHYAVALGAKRFAPRASLGTLILAGQFLDLIWPFFVLAGLERVSVDPGNTLFTPLDFEHYPWSHSLAASIGWGVLFAGVYYAIRRHAPTAFVLGTLVVSHWFLDFLSHRPDLPLIPGGAKVGLGLWNSLAGTMLVEIVLFTTGTLLYLWATRPKDRTGRAALAALIGFLLLIQVANAFSPPPPSGQAVATLALLSWLFPLWGWWIDRHRPPLTEQVPAAV
jgi:hypothetical protein